MFKKTLIFLLKQKRVILAIVGAICKETIPIWRLNAPVDVDQMLVSMSCMSCRNNEFRKQIPDTVILVLIIYLQAKSPTKQKHEKKLTDLERQKRNEDLLFFKSSTYAAVVQKRAELEILINKTSNFFFKILFRLSYPIRASLRVTSETKALLMTVMFSEMVPNKNLG